jgi:hypothetical protein
MALEYQELSRLSTRRDGQIGFGISASAGGSGGDIGSVIYTAGNGIVITGTSISIKTGTTSGSSICGDIYIRGNTRNFGDVLAFSADNAPINWWDALPQATASILGGVKIGAGLQINAGVLSASGATGVSSYNDLTDVPTEFTPVSHNNNYHSETYITGINSNMVTTALGYTPYNNSNPQNYISGITWSAVTSKPTEFTPVSHNNNYHSAVYITSASTVNNANCLNGKTEGNLSVSYACTAGSAPASDVYAWAKAATKPNYTYSEVQALASGGTAVNSSLLENHSASYFQTALTNPILGTGTANYLSKFCATSGLQNSSIFDCGFIGIGTITPQKELEISKSGGATVRITNSYDTAVQDTYIGGIEFWNNDADTPKVSSYIKSYAAETYGRRGYMTLGVSKVINETATEVMRITDNGNVGINKTSPQHELDVCGDIVSSGDIIAYH